MDYPLAWPFLEAPKSRAPPRGNLGLKILMIFQEYIGEIFKNWVNILSNVYSFLCIIVVFIATLSVFSMYSYKNVGVQVF